jgi:hypothetical protein
VFYLIRLSGVADGETSEVLTSGDDVDELYGVRDALNAASVRNGGSLTKERFAVRPE